MKIQCTKPVSSKTETYIQISLLNELRDELHLANKIMDACSFLYVYGEIQGTGLCGPLVTIYQREEERVKKISKQIGETVVNSMRDN